MKQLRPDASHAPSPLLDMEEERPRRPRGDDRRLSQLDAAGREDAADQALAQPAGSLPHQSEMEGRFGRSFSNVRVAEGEGSRQALEEVGADGVSRDQTVAFCSPSPSREVVAHELTHVVQADGAQGGSRDQAEREAYGAEAQLRRGESIDVTPGTASAGVAHFRDEEEDLASFSGVDAPSFNPFGKDRDAAPDEQAVSWTHQMQAPSDPFELVDCTVKIDAPTRPEDPDKEPDHKNEHPSHHRRGPVDFDRPMALELQRHDYWDAFTAASGKAQSAHDAMGSDVEAFRHAENDEELKSLGFIKPDKGWKGDLESFSNEQQVPKQGGASVGSLFNGDNGLKLNKRDERAIDSSGQAMQAGKGSIEESMLGTIAADNQVKEGISAVLGAADGLRSAAEKAKAASAETEFEKYKDDAENDQAEIEALKQEAQNDRDGFNFVLGLASGVVFAASGDVAAMGDAMNQIGVVAGIVADHVSTDKIKRAEAALRSSKARMKSATAKKLQAELEAAKAAVGRELHKMDEVRSKLLQALSARRKAYNDAGTAAGDQADGPESSKDKVAAIMAAIPIVEMVLGRARSITARATPPAYTEQAGRGLGMASYHGYEVSSAFLRACGELNYCKLYFGTIASDWQDRLTALLEVKERIGGPRPETPGA